MPGAKPATAAHATVSRSNYSGDIFAASLREQLSGKLHTQDVRETMLFARQKLGFRHYGLTLWVVTVTILAGLLAVDLTPDGPLNAAQDWLFDT